MSKPGGQFANTWLNSAPLFLDVEEKGYLKGEREKDNALIIK